MLHRADDMDDKDVTQVCRSRTQYFIMSKSWKARGGEGTFEARNASDASDGCTDSNGEDHVVICCTVKQNAVKKRITKTQLQMQMDDIGKTKAQHGIIQRGYVQ